MTLRLVDDDNVEDLDIGNLRDIAGMARRFADQIDDGEWGDVFRAIVWDPLESTCRHASLSIL